MLDVYELETGSHDAVPLANARTGTFSSGATALAVVPRTDFLYALDEGRVVVVETHGTSPYASIPVPGRSSASTAKATSSSSPARTASDLIETGRHALVLADPRRPLRRAARVLPRRFSRDASSRQQCCRRSWASRSCLDGSMFAQARIGMNDIYVATLIVAGWYFVVAAHRPRRSAIVDILIAGVLFGLALASKWAGAYTLAGLLIASIVVTARAYERGRPGHGRSARPSRAVAV